jgi:chemotaxis protein methyltransferase CheR
VFGEMNVIFCRNVLIYFNRELQNRVLRLFTDSLRFGGFLCIGKGESLQFTACAGEYEVVDREQRIFRKIVPAPERIP